MEESAMEHPWVRESFQFALTKWKNSPHELVIEDVAYLLDYAEQDLICALEASLPELLKLRARCDGSLPALVANLRLEQSLQGPPFVAPGHTPPDLPY